MLIVGARGFSKEVLEICHQQGILENLIFYDDINVEIHMIFNKFPVIKNLQQAEDHFKNFGYHFTIGIGNPLLRKILYEKFKGLGGEFVSTISNRAEIGSYDIEIGRGCNILAGSIFSNSVTLGRGCIVYYNAIITHDCVLGDFVEVSPSATILGNVRIGDYSQIGANSTILPGIVVGSNVVIGAGAVVTDHLPDNCVAVGIPAKIIKYI